MEVLGQNIIPKSKQWQMRSPERIDAVTITGVVSNKARTANCLTQRPRRITSISDSAQPLQQQMWRQPLASSLPPRRVSTTSEYAPRAHSFTQAQSTLGLDLLEEWPERESFMDNDDMSLCSSKGRKAVAFSRYSSIHVYPTQKVERKKSYKSVELKKFKAQVGLDVIRVEELLAKCPYKRGNAVCHLIDIGALNPEDLIGIDHLLCGEDAARKIAFDRFSHAKLVVRKQRVLHTEELADVAGKKSRKNVDKALMRARLAELQVKEEEVCTINVRGIDSVERSRRCSNSPAA